jgi:hypothetical protein
VFSLSTSSTCLIVAGPSKTELQRRDEEARDLFPFTVLSQPREYPGREGAAQNIAVFPSPSTERILLIS